MSGPETTSPAVRTVPTVPVGSSGAGARAAAQEAPAAGAPWLHRSCIRRHELYRRLDLAAADAMTMVVAPAGAGKTLGVAGWLQQSRVREGAAWLDASGPLPLSHLEAVLDEAASLRLGRPGIVVVDDAHLLSGRCVRLLDQRLRRSPGTMRVVLIARWDVAVSRLVPELLGHLTVLRGDVLRLDDDEVVELIRIHARDASLEVREAIIERTRGWCAAVVLAARASAAATDSAMFARRCRTSNSGIADLCAGEAFAGLSSRERHVVLCTAMEGTLSVETAEQLTHDPGAGQVLATLEATGLLVTRVSEGHGSGASSDAEARFRLHPLMGEVARRRFAAGGVDAEHARGTLRRAVQFQVGQGRVASALRLLLAMGEHETATAIVAELGPRTVTLDDWGAIDSLVSHAASTVEHHPEAWATLVHGKRRQGATRWALHWAKRLLNHDEAHPGSVPPTQIACMRLHLSRHGVEPVRPALEHACDVLKGGTQASEPDPFLPLLLLEVGVAHNWLGDLHQADRHLRRAVRESRAARLDDVAVEATSHLALTEFMAAHENAADALATQVLAADTLDRSPRSPVVERAEIVRSLVRLQSLPWPEPGEVDPPAATAVDDLASSFWHRILASRAALANGSLADARRFLLHPPDHPDPPTHLHRVALVEQTRLGILTLDHEQVRNAVRTLGALGADGEQAWAAGALADLQGDVRRAADLYERAGETVGLRQPAIGEASRVCAAQLCHYLGDYDRASRHLDAAVAAAARRGDASSFLGWSAHGTPVGLLLREVGMPAGTFEDELVAASVDHEDLVASVRPRVATAHELAGVTVPVNRPSLSPREKDVLADLARGATYADIAANLVVSENTVKTHVSSLYQKLSVRRRSEALATARRLHLL